MNRISRQLLEIAREVNANTHKVGVLLLVLTCNVDWEHIGIRKGIAREIMENGVSPQRASEIFRESVSGCTYRWGQLQQWWYGGYDSASVYLDDKYENDKQALTDDEKYIMGLVEFTAGCSLDQTGKKIPNQITYSGQVLQTPQFFLDFSGVNHPTYFCGWFWRKYDIYKTDNGYDFIKNE